MLYWLHGYTHGRLQLSPRCWVFEYTDKRRCGQTWHMAQPWPICRADGEAVEPPLNTRVFNYCQAVDLRNRFASLVSVLQGAVLGDGSSD